MYVGTLTADEMSFAGATGSTNYTHYLMNSYAKSNYLSWWGLSPGSYDAEYGRDSTFAVISDGGSGDNYVYCIQRRLVPSRSNSLVFHNYKNREWNYIKSLCCFVSCFIRQNF